MVAPGAGKGKSIRFPSDFPDDIFQTASFLRNSQEVSAIETNID